MTIKARDKIAEKLRYLEQKVAELEEYKEPTRAVVHYR